MTPRSGPRSPGPSSNFCWTQDRTGWGSVSHFSLKNWARITSAPRTSRARALRVFPCFAARGTCRSRAGQTRTARRLVTGAVGRLVTASRALIFALRVPLRAAWGPRGRTWGLARSSRAATARVPAMSSCTRPLRSLSGTSPRGRPVSSRSCWAAWSTGGRRCYRRFQGSSGAPGRGWPRGASACPSSCWPRTASPALAPWPAASMTPSWRSPPRQARARRAGSSPSWSASSPRRSRQKRRRAWTRSPPPGARRRLFLSCRAGSLPAICSVSSRRSGWPAPGATTRSPRSTGASTRRGSLSPSAQGAPRGPWRGCPAPAAARRAASISTPI